MDCEECEVEDCELRELFESKGESVCEAMNISKDRAEVITDDIREKHFDSPTATDVLDHIVDNYEGDERVYAIFRYGSKREEWTREAVEETSISSIIGVFARE